MDFDLSEEQRLLKESVDGLLGDAYDFDSRKKYMKEQGGWSKAIWNRFAEQGLLGLPFAEDDGGFGAGAVETMIVMEALGRALVIEPYLATVVIAGGLLRHGASAAQKQAHIPSIIDGSKTFAFAQLEKNSRYDLADVATSAKKKGNAYVIDGEKFVVLNGEAADTFVVTARTKGGQRESTTLVVVATDAALTKGQAKRLAVMAQTGLARAIYPVHTPLDGDVMFAAATGRKPLPDPLTSLAELGTSAANAVARAVARAVFAAAPLAFAPAPPSWQERFASRFTK